MGAIRLNTDSLRNKKDIFRHKVNDGDNVFRILPPFGEVSNGYPYRKWTVAWLADPETGRRRPYASPFSFGEDACPVFEYCKIIEQRRNDEEAKLKTRLMEKGLSDEQIKEKLKEKLKVFNDVLWNLKPKSTFFYNAVSKAGEVGILELKKTAHDFLKKLMSEYIKDYNQDPTSLLSEPDDSGVWINVGRTGKLTNTEYTVTKRQVKVRDPETGKIKWEDDQEPLSDNVVENYETLGYDLSAMYKKVSYSELKNILIANLLPIYEESPELIVSGFGEIEAPVAKREVMEEVKPAAKVLGKKLITTKLDDEDDDMPVVVKARPAKLPQPIVDEDDEEIPVSTKTTKVIKTQKKVDEEDPLEYAERILRT
jgi:hypothetical protein